MKKKKRRFRRKKKSPDVELRQAQPKTVEEIEKEVDDVKNVMIDNIVKIRDREGKLEDLVEKGEILEENAAEFKMIGKKLKRRMWLRQHKMTIIIGIVVSVLTLVVIIFLGVYFGYLQYQT